MPSLTVVRASDNFAADGGDTHRRATGGLAQLGERLAGSQKVRGSSPLSSTFSLNLGHLPEFGKCLFF